MNSFLVENMQKRVSELMHRMTLIEKIAQTRSIQIKAGDLLPDGNLSGRLCHLIGQDGAGAIQLPFRNCTPEESAKYANALQKVAKEQTRLGIPILIHEECLHGQLAKGSTNFRVPIALGCSWDPELVEEVFSCIAAETRSRGGHQALTPVVDLGRDPRWGRIEETYGEDVHLVSEMGIAAVKGMQGDISAGLDKSHIAATLKHFAGYAQSDGGRNFAPSFITKRVLLDQVFVPFERAVKEAGVISVMPSHNEIDGIPCHGNKELLTNILRDEWGFKGIVVNDYFDSSRLDVLHHVVETPQEAAALSLIAGLDMDLPCGNSYEHLTDAITTDPSLLEVLDLAVSRILTMKYYLGLFEDPWTDPLAAKSIVNCQKHKDIARCAAEKSLVLLKNTSNFLPLQRENIKRLAVIGPNANTVQLGGYSPKPYQGASVVEGLRELLGNKVDILYAEGCKITRQSSCSENELDVSQWIDKPELFSEDEEEELINEAVAVAKSADVAIVCVGGNDLSAREAIYFGNNYGDCSDLRLVGQQERLIKSISETGIPVVVVLIHGRPVVTDSWENSVKAILDTWYLGQEAGHAIASALFGDINPGGKLCVTIPRSTGHLPVYYSQKRT